MLERNDPSAVAHDGTSVAHEGIVVTHDGIVNLTPAIDASVLSNESNIFYSNFCVDLSEKLRAANSSRSIPMAWLASSSSSDLLILMHNRTGHRNLRMLIESAKSK